MRDMVFEKLAELAFWDEMKKISSGIPDISKGLKDLKMPTIEKPKMPKLTLKIPELKLPKADIKLPKL